MYPATDKIKEILLKESYISPEDMPSIAAEKRINQEAKTDLELVEEISAQKEGA